MLFNCLFDDANLACFTARVNERRNELMKVLTELEKLSNEREGAFFSEFTWSVKVFIMQVINV